MLSSSKVLAPDVLMYTFTLLTLKISKAVYFENVSVGQKVMCFKVEEGTASLG